MPATREQIRREIRAKRRAIAPQERAAAARRFAVIADRAHLLHPGARVAVYHAYGAEADAGWIMRKAWARGCTVVLPVITHRRAARMEFFTFGPNTPLIENEFGIPEPVAASSTRIAARHLDLIFMPLVAFDDHGWRLGSGAGFYDRCLHHLRAPRLWRRPKLIGVAFAQQQVEALNPSKWDVPMDAVITQHDLQRFQPPHKEFTS